MSIVISFDDSESISINLESSWKGKSIKKDNETQTTKELWQFEDSEVQTGLYTEIIEEVVGKNDIGYNLVSFMSQYRKKRTKEEWNKVIKEGKIGIDGEIVTNPDIILEPEQYIEFVNISCNAETQVSKSDFSTQTDDNINTTLNENDERKLLKFLENVAPIVEQELENNLTSTAFNGYSLFKSDGTDNINLWKILTVDLEKHKVVYPDWSKGNHFPGVIVKCDVTRNKERIYDIDLSDGGRLTNVREEYIRAIVPPDNSNDNKGKKSKKPQNIRLTPGMRLHACTRKNSTGSRYLPGRVIASHRNGTIDVECEGGVIKNGLTYDEVLIGLQEGQEVEARKPVVMPMQCTGISWSCNGSMIAASYGNPSGSGWCDSPGAVCTWSLFSREFKATTPEFVLDHAVCIMCIKCHPINPSIIAAGSFNGEVIVWDVNTPEGPLQVSPIIVESHEDPVMSVDWVYDPTLSTYVVASLGADGKLLLWSIEQTFKKPIRGALLSKTKASSRQNYPSAHGGRSFSFSYGINSRRPQWLIVGQEGGTLVRTQATRILNATNESSERRGVVVYPSLSRQGDTFQHESHIGPVNSIQFSPFHRNLFLTGGQDGTIRLYHVLEQYPIRQWEPTSSGSSITSGSSTIIENDSENPFVPVSCICFSFIRPSVFAVGTKDGYIYIYDLLVNLSSPIHVLKLPPLGVTDSNNIPSVINKGKLNSNVINPIVTGLYFNVKQRDLLCGCDQTGRIFIWKLGWNLSNRQYGELNFLETLSNITENTNEPKI